MRSAKIAISLFAAGVLAAGLFTAVPANADEHGKGRAGASRGQATPENQTYKQECASCHFLYLPGLLPAKSWEKIVKESDKHFGENLSLDARSSAEILKFLIANSAEKTNTSWARKIVKSAGSTVPGRILDVPFIQREHRKIQSEVFKRPSIGSASNCVACHPNAAKGDLDEDNVSIPKK